MKLGQCSNIAFSAFSKTHLRVGMWLERIIQDCFCFKRVQKYFMFVNEFTKKFN